MSRYLSEEEPTGKITLTYEQAMEALGLCVKCGTRKRYERNGRVFRLCAKCAWKNLEKFLGSEVTEAVEHTLAVDGAYEWVCKCGQRNSVHSFFCGSCLSPATKA